MVLSDSHIILIINFLYFLSAGITICAVPYHLLKNGATAMMIGVMYSVSILFLQISPDLFALLPKGYLFQLKCCTWLSLFMYFIPIVNENLLTLVCCKTVHGLTARVINTSKDLILKIEQGDNQTKLVNLLDLLKPAGYILGAIIGGFVYEVVGNFYFSLVLASIITLTCLVLLQQIDRDDNDLGKEKSELTITARMYYNRLKHLKETNFRENFSDLMIPVLFNCLFDIYFTQHVYVFIAKFGIRPPHMGFILAYKYVLISLSFLLIDFLKKRHGENLHSLLSNAMVIGVVLRLGLVFAPSFHCYLLLFGVAVLNYSCVNLLIAENFLDVEDTNIVEASRTLTSIVDALAPLLTAAVFQVFGHTIVRLLTVAPTIFCTYLITKRNLEIEKAEEQHDD